ncbi:MAG: hypothetical protein DME35_07155 [Verrucomicrobia bacterium]|nr:MAG: hypothetical protein DME35_07155 [Verrucomicrobiota bacterium]PYL29815.1 MAG: hypothetical protein DMF45_04345 [Verrucomicrobiota bacterium]
MKRDFRVLVHVGDLKGRNAMMNVDALWMENGIVLVWEWGVKDSEEVPVNYTQLPDAIPNWKPEINGYALERTPVFVEDLDTLGRGSQLPPE